MGKYWKADIFHFNQFFFMKLSLLTLQVTFAQFGRVCVSYLTVPAVTLEYLQVDSMHSFIKANKYSVRLTGLFSHTPALRRILGVGVFWLIRVGRSSTVELAVCQCSWQLEAFGSLGSCVVLFGSRV